MDISIVRSLMDITPRAVAKATDGQLDTWMEQIEQRMTDLDNLDDDDFTAPEYMQLASIYTKIENEQEQREYVEDSDIPRDQLDYPHNSPDAYGYGQ